MRATHVLLLLSIAAAAVLLASGCASTRRAGPPETVPYVDLERYAGLWYQVARYPNSFQRKECRLSTARYTLREDGRVEVRNDCWEDQVGGERNQTVGALARPVDESNSWLRVRFFRVFGADYLIIDLDANYRWAVVTTPNRKLLWILAREPALDESTYQDILTRLDAQGFSTGEILRTSLM